MKIAVPKESAEGEFRVAASPETVKKLTQTGISVVIQTDAGIASEISDEEFQNAGAILKDSFNSTVEQSDIIIKIQPPTIEEIHFMPPKAVLVCLMDALTNPETLTHAAKTGLTCFALELLPRISRAQNMDVLSSQSNLAGYKAVLDAINAYKRAVPMMMTAAGTVSPAQVLVLGAGVAGLQAIATAKRLGAVVTAFDVRPTVKEQVESLGAKFLEIEHIQQNSDNTVYAKELDEQSRQNQYQALKSVISKMDIVITTALVPGKKAPVLITRDMLSLMKKGSVIFDLAAQQGGNCTETIYGQTNIVDGVIVLGQSNAASRLSSTSSLLFSKNIYNFITPMIKKDDLSVTINFDDEIYRATCVVKDGKILLGGNANAR